jgi:predicted nucleic acid-binding protein
MKKTYLVDSTYLIAVARKNHEFHDPCYAFAKTHADAEWVIPPVAVFEFQAAQSRRNKVENVHEESFRELRWPNARYYEVDQRFAQRVWEQDLFNKFEHLGGTDLLYACIAKVESIPLVTRDSNFLLYSDEIVIINPVTGFNTREA